MDLKGMRAINSQNLVKVTDKAGNWYHDTYLKRARGLVRKGKAVFTDDMTICLLKPPVPVKEDIMEQNASSENTLILNETQADTEYINVDDILKEINRIINDKEYLNQALMTIEKIPSDDISGKEKIEAVSAMVQSREATNQSIVALMKQLISNE